MKIYDIEKLDPKQVMYWFKQITLIPHGTYHMEQISKFVAKACKDANAKVKVYPSGMILAKIDATKGYESAPVTMLQSHLDMVLAKSSNKDIDLVKEHITAYYDSESDAIRAEGTSLGADDGIGVAIMLAILNDKTLKHGKLEFVFTVNEEETPGDCVEDFKAGDLSSTYYINLDGVGINNLIYGGAGATTVRVEQPINFIPVPKTLKGLKIDLVGFRGGHSGISINSPHVNAITFMCETLINFMNEHKTKIALSSIEGGPINNAIPQSCNAIIQLEEKYIEPIKKYFIKQILLAKVVAQGQEEKIKANFAEVSTFKKMLDFNLSNNILLAGYLAPNKVFTEKLNHDAMFSSSNLGFMSIKNNKFYCDFKVRSFIDAETERVCKQIVNFLSVLGFNNYLYQGKLSAFINNIEHNTLANIWESAFEEVTNRKLKKIVCPGGLETASFCKFNPAMTENTIIVNANVLEEHSTNESVDLKSIKELWKIIIKVLEEVK